MQTLNVGAGQTDQEYAAAEQQRRGNLRDESRSCANYFFWAAGLAAIGTGVLPLRLTFLVNIGTIDLAPKLQLATSETSCYVAQQNGTVLPGNQERKKWITLGDRTTLG